jgi:diaminopimelate decarboxylase
VSLVGVPIARAFEERLTPLLSELAATYGTPFYIYDEQGIVSTYAELAAAFSETPFRQFFAVKALPTPEVLEILVRAGSGMDCSSPAELELASRAGAGGRDLMFTSNNTSPSEYRLALDAGAYITFDDIRIFERVDVLPDVVSFRMGASVFQSSLNGKNPMSAGGRSKFGVPVHALEEAYRIARDRGASRFGIHGMPIANVLDGDSLVAVATRLIRIAAELRDRLGIAFEYVNLGGGIGIPYRAGESAFPIRAFAAAVVDALGAAFPAEPPTIFTELGRCVTGPHGVLVTRVENCLAKETLTVGVDASMASLLRTAMYRHAHHRISSPLAGERPLVEADVVGSLCENNDYLGIGRELPEPKEGDILLIHDAGAHCHPMGFTYNGRLRPGELLLRTSGEVVEIRRPEAFDDYTATVLWHPRTVLP